MIIQSLLLFIAKLLYLHDVYFAVLCLVALSCPTLCDPMDCSLPGSSVHGDSPDKSTGVGWHVSSRDLPNPGVELGLPVLQADSLSAELLGPTMAYTNSQCLLKNYVKSFKWVVSCNTDKTLYEIGTIMDIPHLQFSCSVVSDSLRPHGL